MYNVIFLSVLTICWMIVASIQDIRKREIANWLNFSLIIFALGFRFFYSSFTHNFGFFYQGLIGLGIFFVIGNIFYYGKVFAGGDGKLMVALGAVLPFSDNFLTNISVFIAFIFIFLTIGGLYGLVWSFVLGIKNFKKLEKEFIIQFKKNRKVIFLVLIPVFSMFLISSLVWSLFFYFAILILVFAILFLYARSIEEVCMVKKISVDDLTEGDWLYRTVKVGRKVVKSKWEGVNKEEIKLIRKYHNKVKVKYGIPFAPVFLISFLFLVSFWFVVF